MMGCGHCGSTRGAIISPLVVFLVVLVLLSPAASQEEEELTSAPSQLFPSRQETARATIAPTTCPTPDNECLLAHSTSIVACGVDNCEYQSKACAESAGFDINEECHSNCPEQDPHCIGGGGNKSRDYYGYKQHGGLDGSYTNLLVIPFMIIIAASMGLICRNQSRDDNNNSGISPSPGARTTSLHGEGPSPTLSAEEKRQRRYRTIVNGIIHKKVKSKKISDEIELPHEEELSTRNLAVFALEAGDTDNKGDLFVNTLRSIRSSLNFNTADDNGSLRYSPKTCPICCEDYVKGDDIAWSKNERCCHAFHTKCIAEWLMDHNDCPMCRNIYLVEDVDLDV